MISKYKTSDVISNPLIILEIAESIEFVILLGTLNVSMLPLKY